MQILKLTEKNREKVLDIAKKVLESSGLIIFPTETCYGAGVLATDQEAVNRLLKYKNRPYGKPVSIAVSDRFTASKYASLNTQAVAVYDRFLPGPVTVVSKYLGGLSDGLISEYGTIGIRIPDYDFILELLTLIKRPITSTSANSSGKKTPYTLDDIFSNLTSRQKSLIDLVIDAGELPPNPPSTVIDTTKEDMRVIRSGALDIQKKIEKRIVKSEKQMRELGCQIVQKYLDIMKSKGLLVLFNAELGAGKTQLVKGFAKALGIEEIIKSPTYSLIEEYESSVGNLIHIDVWRLENIAEFSQLNVEKYALPGNIIAVEWSGGAIGLLEDISKDYGLYMITIEIVYTSENTREVKIKYS